jgi:hypothetical protein
MSGWLRFWDAYCRGKAGFNSVCVRHWLARASQLHSLFMFALGLVLAVIVEYRYRA